MNLLVKFLIMISSYLILSTSLKLKLVLELVDDNVGKEAIWFLMDYLGCGGGRANILKWKARIGAGLGGKLGMRGIMDFDYNFPKDIDICSKIFAM